MTDPQQPTQEAAIERARQSAPEFVRMCRIDEPLEVVYRKAEEYLADMLDRFAAQRVTALEDQLAQQSIDLGNAISRAREAEEAVTAAPVSGDAHDLGLSVAADWLANRVDTDDHRELASFVEKHAAPALTAATDKARREAIAEAFKQLARIRDKSKRSLDWCNALNEMADALHRLTPHNPGDAAAQDGT